MCGSENRRNIVATGLDLGSVHARGAGDRVRWVRGVTYGEDATARTSIGPHLMAAPATSIWLVLHHADISPNRESLIAEYFDNPLCIP